MKRKWVIILIAVLSWSLLTPKTGLAFSIDARAAILMDPVSGKILFEQNKDLRWPPASVTKVMTMLLIMEAVESGRVEWSDPIRTSAFAAGMGGSQVYLKEGEEFSLAEMFKTIAMVSANDASTAVAEHLYGSSRDFIEAMNRRAQELGLKNTHFVNETGLPDPAHYSSAYDLAVISRELLKYPEVLKYTSIWLDDFRDGTFQLRNTNELIRVYRGADGLKTGHTEEAKYCLAATAQKGGFRLLSVILGAESDAKRVSETRRLLDYGYRNFQWKQIKKAGQEIGQIYQKSASPEMIPVKLKKDFGLVVERGRDQLVETQLAPLSGLKYPLKAGARVGVLKAVYQGEVLAEEPVYTMVEVKKANLIVQGWRWLRDWARGLLKRKPLQSVVY
ncbi:MAG: D-alanyl-D-alanine carboxypeptidase [Firmicutes bacterium]|nr:D-alanyl-D-alanine carboxypeptidase [Bacillota bacterium]